jgi:hypothetical protein
MNRLDKLIEKKANEILRARRERIRDKLHTKLPVGTWMGIRRRIGFKLGFIFWADLVLCIRKKIVAPCQGATIYTYYWQYLILVDKPMNCFVCIILKSSVFQILK